MLSEEKFDPCFVRQTISWSSNESSRKHETIALKSTLIKQWNSLLQQTDTTFSSTSAVRNLFLRSLTYSHMTILSKSNYCVRLNKNMNIADSISFYFNFGKGCYFVFRVKQHIFVKAQFFLMNEVNPAIVNWRENDRNLLTPFAIIWKLSRQNVIRKKTSFPLTPQLY